MNIETWNALDEKLANRIRAGQKCQHIASRIKENIKRTNALSDVDIRKKFYQPQEPDADPEQFSRNLTHRIDPVWRKLNDPGFGTPVYRNYLCAVPYTVVFDEGVRRYRSAIVARTMTQKEYDFLRHITAKELAEHLWETTPRKLDECFF